MLISDWKRPQEAYRPLEGSGRHLLDLPPHDDLQKIKAGLPGYLTTRIEQRQRRVNPDADTSLPNPSREVNKKEDLKMGMLKQ